MSRQSLTDAIAFARNVASDALELDQTDRHLDDISAIRYINRARESLDKALALYGAENPEAMAASSLLPRPVKFPEAATPAQAARLAAFAPGAAGPRRPRPFPERTFAQQTSDQITEDELCSAFGNVEMPQSPERCGEPAAQAEHQALKKPLLRIKPTHAFNFERRKLVALGGTIS